MPHVLKWIITPFGSLNQFLAVYLFFLITRFADMATTQYFLSRYSWSVEMETNLVGRILLQNFDFTSVVAGNIILSSILLILVAQYLFWALYKLYPARKPTGLSLRGVYALIAGFSVQGTLIVLWNMELFPHDIQYSIMNALSWPHYNWLGIWLGAILQVILCVVVIVILKLPAKNNSPAG
ncbi:MAG: hypothetical protein A3A80_04285 [Candidatus Terrybacteria bacterium RIFCSPLOWO2_01_FULL_44_24]|uniref:Uncharacterized protein n=1 Tax=Candidatus Terrybacteria bacterium RIFCSPHIGHO2_01_FULL_43_35 TaxID=1802361 RepID=A0A1G2PC53_9BACT|nr:MAG: hypothetical protein A2828_01160 [Candidatus Terrybacteria bacterium RIFCSPHIGHO2_01_FULL_43_35]OHA49639.1 MAG: hypothetical protein A3B75_00940 [Candidatus Terrybacteria bacterium RIFCSPHIGHO2_02_FULL_43_14]OHA51304.1 MAG: hypothetical protein A3A80_04285 [Candidatus Terrybacteria bacterium RIFCSPLOWO2_01_FULL_44_24]